MKFRSTAKILILSLLCALAVSRAGAQGPPYQTDDPVPVDLHHYEFYIFGGVDGTTGGDRFHRPGLRVQLGRTSARAIARDSALGRRGSVEQPRLSSRRRRARRHSASLTWNSAPRSRGSRRRSTFRKSAASPCLRCPRATPTNGPRRGQGLVQAAHLAAEKLRQMALRWRRRLPGGAANRLSQLSLHRLAHQARAERAVGAWRRGFCARR